jgi:tetratricopeptide (TPR) repeat protein
MEVALSPETAATLNDEAVKLQADAKYPEARELYKKSLAIWQSTHGSDDLLVAQSFANLASLYRKMREYDEAERVFQLAQRIWLKRGWPSSYDRPLWADQLESSGLIRNFGADVRDLRDRLPVSDAAAEKDIADILQRLGP